jgi:arsenate reductase
MDRINMKVLFLCTGNSCRSQIAEAMTNHFRNTTWTAFSAGTKPAGYVHPKALEVLEEIQIEHLGESKNVNEYQDEEFDLVITVCDEAAETCPIWLGKGAKIHLGFVDPAKAEGTEEEILEVFRNVRDQIQEVILSALDEFYAENAAE